MKIDTGLPLAGPADPREAARHAEEAGYDALWAAEVKHDPFVALTLAATVTERAELGTSIALAFARNPMSLAATANDLQVLSGGRLLLGLGTQVRAHITRRFSMPWSRPAARMREFVLALRAIWECWADGTRLDFRGEFYTHTLMTPMFVPEPHGFGTPKVLLAGVGEAMTRTAAEVADGFLCHGFTTERYLREVTVPALRRGRGGELGDFQLVGLPMIATGRTEEELARAVAGVRAQIAFYGSTPAYGGVLDLHGWGALGEELHALSTQGEWERMGTVIDDAVLNAVAVVGEPEMIAPELLRRYGDLFSRCSLYTPWDADAALVTGIATELRQGAAEEGQA
ncbi:TIGR03617 family F420-dependent LLM class oxidoreductase [Pseudonocardia sp. NPDC049154]|uniref:TIGR03617 family F420-dependent LLM class oxidoreductase n=1 Tax=Pseudonocardia sp. NPDC049154 TaxID=3155501 RepID=UPI0033EA7C51